MAKKRTIARPAITPLTPITVKQRKRIAKQLEKDRERLRKRYPEIHGKVVDFITHAVSDDVLYLSVRFTDDTNFSIRYAAEMFVVGVDLSDWKTGNMDMIRQYMKPIPR